MNQGIRRSLLTIWLSCGVASAIGCTRVTVEGPAVAAPTPVKATVPERTTDADICDKIEATTYRELPRRIAGNQLDPSGLSWVGDELWLVNDREGREAVPPQGNGVIRLDPDSGEVEHVAVPGYDDVSRKFEGLAWDGTELHAIGNVGKREANTFLVSFPLDPATSLPTGQARYHDLACTLGTAIGQGCEPWGHGLKIEGLAALGRGDLAIGLRRNGDGIAARGYRATLPPGPGEGMTLEPIPAIGELDLGTARRGSWSMDRELGGLADAACEPAAVLGVAAAEYQQEDVWEFLPNALFLWWPDRGTARRLCAFDDGLKVEGVAFAPSADEPCRGTLALLYDNDSRAPGGYKVVHDVLLPLE